MTVRKRLLLVFFGCGVVPLLVLGGIDYRRTGESVRMLLARQGHGIDDRVLADMQVLLDRQASDLALLSNNAETQRWLSALARRPGWSTDTADAGRSTAAFFASAWPILAPSYARIRLRDARGRILLELADPTFADDTVTERHVITALAGDDSIGSIEYQPHLAPFTRVAAMSTKLGRDGFNLLYDRTHERLLYAPAAVASSPAGERLVAALHADGLREARGSLVLDDGDGPRLAAYENLRTPQWTLLATGSLDELAGPLLRQRSGDLAILVIVVLAIAVGLIVLLRHVSVPLARLTTAAERVSAGDLDPALAPATDDEFGTLSAAFATMITRIRQMIRQVESSRQMAVLGEFAAQLSHEIRNPLTSVKINLQGLNRDARAGRLPEDSATAVRLALREVERLDGVARGVLRMARMPAEPQVFGVDAVVRDALDTVGAQARQKRVLIQAALDGETLAACGDPEALRAAILNLLINAVESQPNGGEILVRTHMVEERESQRATIEIRDRGPGMTAEQLERAFEPFYTTKQTGTGLGLPIALRAVRAQGGALDLSAPVEGGTVVRITLPLAREGVPA